MSGLIRQHNSTIIILGRLIDSSVIGMTLWAVLEMKYMMWDAMYTWWLLISIFSFQIFAEFNNLYKESRGTSVKDEIQQIFISWFCAILVFGLVEQFVSIVIEHNRQVFIYWCLAVPVELVSWHIISGGLINKIRKMGRNSRRVAIIGDTRLGHELETIFQQENWMGLSIVGFFDDRQTTRELQKQHEIEGDIEKLIAKAKVGEIDIIYMALLQKI